MAEKFLIVNKKYGKLTLEKAILDLRKFYKLASRQALIERLVFDAHAKEIEKK